MNLLKKYISSVNSYVTMIEAGFVVLLHGIKQEIF